MYLSLSEWQMYSKTIFWRFKMKWHCKTIAIRNFLDVLIKGILVNYVLKC